ncbi:MAG: patatin-like phospholipase family protein [Hyphomicrobiaceae bacterium]
MSTGPIALAKYAARSEKHTKAVNLALQGGGAHGAFTWGVLDRMFEDGRIWVDAISGTSAGAMNAVVASQGMYDGGGAGARAELERFWHAVSKAGQASPIKRSPMDRLLGNWSLDTSPGYVWLDLMSRVASPYDTNPMGIDPLRDLVDEFVDFDKVRDCEDMPIFISATNVETGRVRVFPREEITADVVMASACLPSMFHAVEIDGVPYWDGGFMGNPVLFPFAEHSPCSDIVIVQINPVVRKGTPRTAREIQNRVNEITFNSSLMKELRAIDFVDRLIDEGKLSGDEYRRLNVHIIEATEELSPLGASSKLNSEWSFLVHLKDIGRQAAARWIDANFDQIGERSTVDLRAMFGEIGMTHRG